MRISIIQADPLLYAKGFKRKIYATRATTDLARSCLQDSAHIQEFEAGGRTGKQGDLENQKLYQSIRWMMRSMLCGISCHAHMEDRFEVADGITIKFTDIGHLLGSSALKYG